MTGNSNWWGVSYGTWEADSLETVLSTTEDIKDAADMDCSSRENWWDYCTREESGGTGFAWTFQLDDPSAGSTGMGTLYLRIVNFACYNYNQYEECESDYSFEFEGMEVRDVNSGFSFTVEASCPGCAVARTHAGVDYYEVDEREVTCPLSQLLVGGGCEQSSNPSPAPGVEDAAAGAGGGAGLLAALCAAVPVAMTASRRRL